MKINSQLRVNLPDTEIFVTAVNLNSDTGLIKLTALVRPAPNDLAYNK